MGDQLKQAAFILSFYNGEEFANNKDTLLSVPPALYDFVTDATPETVDDMWDDLLETDALTEFYDEMIEAVIDFDEKTWNTKFNNGDVKIAYGDNEIIINIQPTDVSGVETAKAPPYIRSKGLIRDMGLYNIAVKFYIVDKEYEQGEEEAFEDLDGDKQNEE